MVFMAAWSVSDMTGRRVCSPCAWWEKPLPGCTAPPPAFHSQCVCVCVCQLSRWSLILTTGKSQSHNAMGVMPNEEAALAIRNQSQLEWWNECVLFVSLWCRSIWTGPLFVQTINTNWLFNARQCRTAVRSTHTHTHPWQSQYTD